MVSSEMRGVRTTEGEDKCGGNVIREEEKRRGGAKMRGKECQHMLVLVNSKSHLGNVAYIYFLFFLLDSGEQWQSEDKKLFRSICSKILVNARHDNPRALSTSST